MGIEGRLSIDLDRAGDGRGRARIASTRPLKLTKSFVGKSAEDAVAALPILFNVCRNAQGAAAAQACERAMGLEADAETSRVRAVLVLVESLREHLVRVVIDWPRFLGEVPQRADLLDVMRLCERLRSEIDPHREALSFRATARVEMAKLVSFIDEAAALVERLVLGEAIEAWRARRTSAQLAQWAECRKTAAQRLIAAVGERDWATAGEAPVRFLPQLSDSELGGLLLGDDAEAFVAAPTWNDETHETSALARQANSPLVGDLARNSGYGLLVRLAARLVEIGDLPHAMATMADGSETFEGSRAESRTAGRGLAQVETARGRLVHGVEIKDGIVRRYAILAPTEWNFHVDGCAAQGLADIAGRQADPRQLAELFVIAVDPCVGFEVRVN
jgi:coenzyme F420-reducing hydrogenase alpha subunit